MTDSKPLYDRWRSRLNGTRKRLACGRYDNEIELAKRFSWTPAEVGALPAAYYDELITALNADADHAALVAKRAERTRNRG